MDSLATLDSGQFEITLTDGFDDMMKRLSSAHKWSRFTAFATQLYASWIVFNALWETKTDNYYVDHRTGEIHESFDSAPDDVKPRLMLRHKRTFNTQTEFFNYLAAEIPDFSISTFWSRYRTILKRIEVWRKANYSPDNMPESLFMSIVEDIVLYGKNIDDVVINGLFDITPARKGVPSMITSLSYKADLGRLGIEGEYSDDELIREVAITVLDKLEDAHDQVRAGAMVNSVTADLKNELFNESTIGFISYGSDIFLKYTPGSNGDIIPTIRYKIQFMNDSGGVIETCDLDREVIEWLERSLRITIRGLQ